MEQSLRLISLSPRQTTVIGQTLATYLQPGDTVALFGDLGAGKTLLSQAIGKGLGIKRVLRSPTFVVEARYPVQRRRIRTLYHLDLYRLPRLSSVDTESIREAMIDPRGITVIEWADRLSRLPRGAIKINIKISAEERRLNITGLPSRAWKSLARLPLVNAAATERSRTRSARHRRRPSAQR